MKTKQFPIISMKNDWLGLTVTIMTWLLGLVTVVLMVACGTMIFIEFDGSTPVDHSITKPAFIALMVSYFFLMVLATLNSTINGDSKARAF